MPKYLYRCNKCKREFEVSQSINEKPLEECIYCPGICERVIGQVNVNTYFKGSHNLTYRK